MFNKITLITLTLIGFAVITNAQTADPSFSPPPTEGRNIGLYSPQSAETFFNLACEILEPEDVSIQEVKEAVVMMNAAEKLDRSISTMLPQILKAAMIDSRQDYSRLVRSHLYRFVSSTSDSELAMRAVSYLLSKVNTREEREQILQSLIQDLASSNQQFASQLSMSIGVLAAETADFDTASRAFLESYNSNPYNVVAFEKLAEVSPDIVSVAMMGPYLRRKITLNPYSLELALDYADYAYQYELYDIARDTYRYAADVYEYQNPGEAVPERVYLPWIMSAMNVEYGEANALKVVSRIRKQGTFNLAVEYISIMAEPLSASQRRSRLGELSKTALQMLSTGHPAVNEQGLAFFYTFMYEDNRRAADMAKIAYAKDSESIYVRSLYAYTLLQSGDVNTAEEMVQHLHEYNQIAAYTHALIQLEKADTAAALATLRRLITMEPGSFVAKAAGDKLAERGAEYFPENDPEALKQLLNSNFIASVVPEFFKPEETVTTKVSLSGVEFGYGTDLGVNIIISNNGKQPLVITDSSFFKGEIYIRVNITGDIEGIMPIEIRKRVTPVSPIRPGGTLAIPIRLNVEAAKLSRILNDFPQATLNLSFTAYFDPALSDDGKVTSMIPVANTSCRRLGVMLTEELLDKRIESLQTGQAGQKIHTIRLINGLIAERGAAEKYGVLYKHKAIPQDSFEKAFSLALEDENWQVRLLILDVLRFTGTSFESHKRFSDGLLEEQWPIRLLSLYCLSKLPQNDDFEQVINWMNQSDEEQLVRTLAQLQSARFGLN